jgi:hypothetical protein
MTFSPTTRRARAFAPIESVAIVAILIGLPPAVQKVREVATSCGPLEG